MTNKIQLSSLYGEDKKPIDKMTIRELVLYHEQLMEKSRNIEQKDRTLMAEINEMHTVLGDYKVSFDNKQMAIKIDMNSLYGMLGNKWSRWCNYDIALAITSSSAAMIQFIGNFINEQFREMGYRDVLVYIDTDSVYLSMEQIVNERFPTRPEDYNIVRKFLSEYFEETVQPMIDTAITLKLTDMNAGDIHAEHEHLKMSREVIGSAGFWKTKKKYAIEVHDNEGMVYEEPKLKIMGLEIIRRTSPKFIKENMDPVLKMILRGEEDKLSEFNKVMREKFRNSPLTDISPVKPANNLRKYWTPDTNFKSGTPSHVRAVLRYNQLLGDLQLQDKYDAIKEGDKVHFIYLKEPNLIGLKYIAFPLGGSIPKEFGISEFIDFPTQFEKVYANQVREFTDILNWAYSDRKRLDYFFKTKKDKGEDAPIKKRRRRVPKQTRIVKAAAEKHNEE